MRNGIKVAYVMPVNHLWHGLTEFSLRCDQPTANLSPMMPRTTTVESSRIKFHIFSKFDFVLKIVDNDDFRGVSITRNRLTREWHAVFAIPSRRCRAPRTSA